MDSSVSLEDRIWFLRVCHHVPFSLYTHRTPQMNLSGTDLNQFRTNFPVRPFTATLQLLHLVLTNYFLVCVMRATRLTGRTFLEFVHRNIWLRWSMGSVLAFSTQDCGFKPGRSRRIFRAKKNPQHVFLRRGSKAVGPMS